jgi:hypothetical protein
MKTKTRPTPDTLPGEWTTRQYEPPRASSVLQLPEPQPKFIHPPGPGKRPDGRLWFDGETRKAIATDKVELARMAKERLPLDGSELPMRDFRQGDRWLPWHFKDKPRSEPIE